MTAAQGGFTTHPRSKLELSFRRLLRKCETAAQGEESGWKTDPVFHAYVETLQENLSDLSNNDNAALPTQELDAYRRHVAALSKALQPPELPAYCKLGTKLERLSRRKAAVTNGPSRGSELRSATAASGVRGDASGRSAEEEEGTEAHTPSTASQERLQMHRNLQESLIEDLSQLASGLKNNSLAVEEQLKKRAAVLEEADKGLNQSANTMSKNAALAGKVESKTRSMTCYTLLVLCAVMGIFMAVAVFIKLTSIAGYRAPSGRTEL